MTLILFLLICASVYFAVAYFGIFATTIVAAIVLSFAFKIRYARNGLGIELAYWGLSYSLVAILLLGIGLTQSHYGCLFLIGDCYQPALPRWVDHTKTFVGFYVVALNAFAILRMLSFSFPKLLPRFIRGRSSEADH